MEKLKLITDNPLLENKKDTSKDGLNFDKYSEVLSNAILGTSAPFTVGIYGNWGTGKTSLMKLMQEKLQKDKDTTTVWFNAWKFEKEEHPIVPLIATIVQEIEKEEEFLESLKANGKKIMNSLRALAYGFSFKSKIKISGFAEVEASMVAKDIINREERLNRDPLLDKTLYYGAFESLEEVTESIGDKKIVIFIDDLDRCFPNKAIELLESMKLVFSQNGFIFVLGVAKTIIEEYLSHRYNKDYGIEGFNGASYLDKIVQLPFTIPSHEPRIEEYAQLLLEKIDKKDDDNLKSIIMIISKFKNNNPRSIIRFINSILINDEIYKVSNDLKESEKINDYIGYFAINDCLMEKWESFYNEILNEDTKCEIILKYAKGKYLDLESVKIDELKKTQLDLLKKLKDDEDLFGLFSTDYGKNWCEKHEIRKSVSLFIVRQKTQEEKNEIKTREEKRFLKKIIKLDEERKFKNLEDYKNQFVDVNIDGKKVGISKYLVTNSWYDDYLKDNKDNKDIEKPQYWEDERFNAPNQPVVGISFDEAKAFCKWASENNDNDFYYDLLDGNTWQKAAQGDEKTKYPWGDDWDEKKCNNRNLNLGKTTAVGIFEDGNSKDGLCDMAGNVLEWTQDENKKFNVLRGGSWNDSDSSYFRCGTVAIGTMRLTATTL